MNHTKFAEVRARRALAAAGLPAIDAELTRVDSATNEVWAHGDVVVRVSTSTGPRLRREALLAAHLPEAIRYPEVLAVGGEGGVDWLVLDRVPGLPLVRCWPGMTVDDRRSAVGQLARAVEALHAMPAPVDLPEPTRIPHLLQSGPSATDPLLAGLDRAASLTHVDRGAIRETVERVQQLGGALDPFDGATLVHGDLHFQNVLWDGSQVTAVLDFEFARGAPPDLDLDVLLRFCAFPHLFVPVGRESEAGAELYEVVPLWFADAYPALFAHPRLRDRLRLYAIAFDVRDLLANPPRRPATQLTPHHPYRRLLATVRDRCYLDTMAFG